MSQSPKALQYYQEIRQPKSATGKSLLEMPPQYYPGEITYQKDSLFTPISVRNFGDYIILGADSDLAYCIDPQHTTGFAFRSEDIAAKPSLGMVPALRLSLRDSGIRAYKQAYKLRIREDFALKGVATTWYLSYVERFEGIVSDFDHLEGGKCLWKSFIRTAIGRGLSISVMETTTGEARAVDSNTPEEEVWTTTLVKRSTVLVLERPQSVKLGTTEGSLTGS